MTDRDLRITWRCRVDDLLLPVRSEGRAVVHVGAHRIVEAFVERRSQSPVGQATFRCATRDCGVTIYTLHSGDDRGATWHEVEKDTDDAPSLDVVWLLGVKPAHDYDGLCDLCADDRLLPAEIDYEELVAEASVSLASVIAHDIPALRARANAQLGTLIESILGDRIPVRLYRDPDRDAPLLTVAIQGYPLPGALTLGDDWLIRTILAFFPYYPESVDTANSLGPYALLREVAFCGFPEN